MNDNNATVIIHMVCSLDGYIAAKDGDVSWLESKDQFDDGVELSDDDIQAFLKKIDCYIIGAHTYEHALQLGWPYGKKPVFVLSKRKLERHYPSVTILQGELVDIVNDLKSKYKTIWMGGGSRLTKSFLQKQLADQLIVTIMPVILGGGISFFDNIQKKQSLHLQDIKAYKDGMVELTYQVLRD